MNLRTPDLNPNSPESVIRVAHAVSNVVSPPVVSAVLGFLIAWVELPFWPGLAWATVYGFMTCLVPMGVILYLLKTGRVSDLHIGNRNERHIPYLIGFVCAVLALLVLSAFSGSQLLRALAVCNIAGLATLGSVNTRWLISNHTASIMLATVFAGFVFGVTASVVLMPLVGLTFWARLLLRRHTVAQLLAGLFAGAAPVLVLASLGYVG